MASRRGDYGVIRDAVPRAAPRLRRRPGARRTWYLNPAAVAAIAFCACVALCDIILLAYPAITCRGWKFQAPTARFLFLADPQMEGSDKAERMGRLGELDLAFNDAYTRHVFTAVVRHRRPSHVVVLGDLFSSQWIPDAEFADRVQRYLRIFRGATPFGGTVPADVPTPLLINITGNHDIGYEADLTERRVQRWEEAFGSSNFDFFVAPDGAFSEAMEPPVYGLRAVKESTGYDANSSSSIRSSGSVHVVVLNSMVLDSRRTQSLHQAAWRFLGSVAEKRQTLETPAPPLVLMMHVPLHKRDGMCVDSPTTWRSSDGHIVEQNTLLPQTSHLILSLLRPTWVFTGHDHEGCLTERFVWRRRRPSPASSDGYHSFPGAAAGETVYAAEETQDGSGQEAYSSYWRVWPSKQKEEWEFSECVLKVEGPTVEDDGDDEVPAECLRLPGKSDADGGGAWEFVARTREITVRSVMAEFRGYAGLWEFASSPMGPVRFSYSPCAFVTHPLVWAVLVTNVLTSAVTTLGVLLACCLSKRVRRRFFWPLANELWRRRTNPGKLN